jgi:hypothetical protein
MYCRVKLGRSTGWSPPVEGEGEGEGGEAEREGIAQAEGEGEGEGKVEVEGKAWGQGKGEGEEEEGGSCTGIRAKFVVLCCSYTPPTIPTLTPVLNHIHVHIHIKPLLKSAFTSLHSFSQFLSIIYYLFIQVQPLLVKDADEKILSQLIDTMNTQLITLLYTLDLYRYKPVLSLLPHTHTIAVTEWLIGGFYFT